MHIILETPRLILRHFTEEDASFIHLLNSNPEVVKYVQEAAIHTVEQARDIIRHTIFPQYENNLGRWAIQTKADNELIGWCGLKQLRASGEIDVGYRLLQTAWGKGFATEAAGNVLHYSFTKLHLREVTGKAHAENIASIKVLQKIGMLFINDEIEDDSPIKVFRAANPI